ncbi:MAG TPA: ABC-type transport auxiliary lipoprotein family protein [Ramlibacter sp.]|uniref:ABC-type transport auxiliary lipoprotein family protein n=1 Tax=Ramlibacter sp. TaxID=1917967 RepID=UPI002BFFAA2B|nr:ABC-type transport auxiliary lipoprotein family protein [Ramlibacter sp.]HVZ43870.1 ABC-type transport auxiliary lipoprotein family protein [Ramlibacter sp.]
MLSLRPFRLLVLLAASLAAACSSILPDKPVRPTLYDFGPGVVAAGVAPGNLTQPPILLAEVDVSSTFEGTPIMYRLGYADANQVRPYSLARWSAPPAQLVRQRIREHLGRDRLVLDNEEAAALVRSGGAKPRVLRIELEEFTHYFESQAKSFGLVRLRCTLLDNTSAGERLVAQRTITLQSPAASPDASGGVRALAAATDEAAQEVARWLQGQR